MPELTFPESLFLIPFAASMAISLIVALQGFRQRHLRGAVAFSLVALSQAVYTFGYIFELSSNTIEGKIAWDYLQFFPAVLWPVALIVFSIQYSQLRLKKPRLVFVIVSAATIAATFIILLDLYHPEIYRDAHLLPGSPFDELRYTFTPGVYVNFALFVAMILAALVNLGLHVPAPNAPQRPQYLIVFVGSLVSAAGLAWGTFDIRIGAIFRDISPFTFAVSNLIVGWGMYRHHLLDIVPIARERVLEVTRDLVIVTDSTGRVVDLNPAIQKRFPSKTTKTFGRPLDELFHFQPEIIDAIHGADRGDAESSALVFPDGAAFRFEKVSLPGGGSVYFGHDVSADLKAEELLRHQNVELEGRVEARTRDLIEANRAVAVISERLTEIINALPFVVIGVDQELRITYWNRSAEIETEIPSSQATGSRFAEVWKSAFPDTERLKECILSGVPSEYRDREEKTVSPRVFTLSTLRVPGGAVLIREDVTVQTRLQDTIVHTEKMISVGGLAAGMAHELNNPLAGVLQTLQVLQSRLTLSTPRSVALADGLQLDKDRFRELIDKQDIPRSIAAAIEAGDRMARIITNMLSFSAKRADQVDVFDLTALLDETVGIARADYNLDKRFDFKKIAIRRDYEPDLPFFQGNRSKIQQVFFNLLKNGAEAMQETADQRHPEFAFTARRDHGFIRIEIGDNGPGMNASVQARVFDPFFTTKPPGVGTGLGMSVSYFIITENHGGEMSVSSSPDHGCRFTIRLPIPSAGGGG